MPLPSNEALKLEQDAKLFLFTLDLSPIGSNIQYRFCAESQTDGADIVFQGNVFTAYPIEASGFERNNRGQSPNPTISASNTSGILSALLRQNGDLVGAKLTRQKVYAKHLDGAEEANPLMEFIPDVYYVSRKPSENTLQIVLELQNIASFGNQKLPRRRLQKNLCPWGYRESDCGYTGSLYFDKFDRPTNEPTLDKCGKRLTSCQLRFGQNAPLPFGGFPGVDQ